MLAAYRACISAIRLDKSNKVTTRNSLSRSPVERRLLVHLPIYGQTPISVSGESEMQAYGRRKNAAAPRRGKAVCILQMVQIGKSPPLMELSI